MMIMKRGKIDALVISVLLCVCMGQHALAEDRLIVQETKCSDMGETLRCGSFYEEDKLSDRLCDAPVKSRLILAEGAAVVPSDDPQQNTENEPVDTAESANGEALTGEKQTLESVLDDSTDAGFQEPVQPFEQGSSAASNAGDTDGSDTETDGSLPDYQDPASEGDRSFSEIDPGEEKPAKQTEDPLVRVTFVCDPPHAKVTVYAPAVPDENGCASLMAPYDTNVYWLLPGEYFADAACDGYTPLYNVPVKVGAGEVRFSIELIPLTAPCTEEPSHAQESSASAVEGSTPGEDDSLSGEDESSADPEGTPSTEPEEGKGSDEASATGADPTLNGSEAAAAEEGGVLLAKSVPGAGMDGKTAKTALRNVLPSMALAAQPVDFTGEIGNNATFSVAAEGEGISYQWQVKTSESAAWKDTTIYGYQTERITVPIIAARHHYRYRCVLTQSGETITSETALLTVLPSMKLAAQPVDFTGEIGNDATFSVAAEGEGIGYRWQVKTSENAAWKDTTIYGYRTATITVPMIAARHHYRYRCVLTQRGETITSESALLTILPSMELLTQPEDYSGKTGDTATFSVAAEGEGISYQWQVKTSENAAWKDTTIYGYRTATITVPVTAERDHYQYRCILTQRGETITSESALLTVLPSMELVAQPRDYTGTIGDTATFSVVAEGEGISYQWQVKTSETAAWKNTTIRGYRTATITVPITREREDFQWRCILTQNQDGPQLTSDPVRLVIVEPHYTAPMLTIIDDDGDIHFLTDVLPLIRELNVSIATAVTPTRVGSKTRWMRWEDIAYCAANGAEVLCHTYSHYSGTEIQSIDDATIIRQYGMAKSIFEERGYNSDILVYSSSTGNIERVRNDAAQVFQCGIKIGGNKVNSSLTDRFALNRCRIDYAETEGKTSWNRNDIRQYIDDVAETGGWQIFMFHTSNSLWRQRVLLDDQGKVIHDDEGNVIPMTDGDGNPVLDNNGQYPTVGTECYIPMLREAIQYAQSRGVAIVTAETGYSRLYNE